MSWHSKWLYHYYTTLELSFKLITTAANVSESLIGGSLSNVNSSVHGRRYYNANWISISSKLVISWGEMGMFSLICCTLYVKLGSSEFPKHVITSNGYCLPNLSKLYYHPQSRLLWHLEADQLFAERIVHKMWTHFDTLYFNIFSLQCCRKCFMKYCIRILRAYQ